MVHSWQKNDPFGPKMKRTWSDSAKWTEQGNTITAQFHSNVKYSENKWIAKN